MASDVDIVNLALAEIGDTATVTSLNPPSGSVQAAICARFYPMARDALLEMHTWQFATKRVSLALLSESNQPNQWTYTYAQPTDALNLMAVLDPAGSDDYVQGLVLPGSYPSLYSGHVGYPSTKLFATEIDANGQQIVLTNQANAVLHYTAAVTDPTQFSPLFTQGLAKLLASMLAGPIIKGSEGRNVASQKQKEFQAWFTEATESDSNQRNIKPAITTSWIVNR